MNKATDVRQVIRGKAESSLPPGMTQEEADRLVREADQRSREQQK